MSLGCNSSGCWQHLYCGGPTAKNEQNILGPKQSFSKDKESFGFDNQQPKFLKFS